MASIAIDVETTGLNPWEDRVLTIAMYGDQRYEYVNDSVYNEAELIQDVRRALQIIRPASIVTWNGTEFDFPFLAVRAALTGVVGPIVRPSGFKGKYGKPRFDGQWAGAPLVDVAYYDEYCEQPGVKWSLKPTARHVLGLDPIELPFEKTTGTKPCVHVLDFGGAEHEYDYVKQKLTMLDYTAEQRQALCLSDAKATWRLQEHHLLKSVG